MLEKLSKNNNNQPAKHWRADSPLERPRSRTTRHQEKKNPLTWTIGVSEHLRDRPRSMCKRKGKEQPPSTRSTSGGATAVDGARRKRIVDLDDLREHLRSRRRLGPTSASREKERKCKQTFLLERNNKQKQKSWTSGQPDNDCHAPDQNNKTKQNSTTINLI